MQSVSDYLTGLVRPFATPCSFISQLMQLTERYKLARKCLSVNSNVNEIHHICCDPSMISLTSILKLRIRVKNTFFLRGLFRIGNFAERK